MESAGLSFGTIWEAIADKLGDEVVIRDGDRTWTYAEFDQRASRLAAAFRDAGLGVESKVALYLYNGTEYLEAVFAAIKIGAVPVNANYRYRGDELSHLLADADAEALLFDHSLRDYVGAAARDVATLRLIMEIGGPDQAAGAAAAAQPGSAQTEAAGPNPYGPAYNDVLAAHEPLPHQGRTGTDQMFMYTGGTTGYPKGVVWQQADLLMSFEVQVYGAIGRSLPATLDDAVEAAVHARATGQTPVIMPVVPLMHGTGYFNTVGAMCIAGTVVFARDRSLNPANIWQTVQDERVTTMIVAGNAVLRPLADELERAAAADTVRDLTSVRMMISSGLAMSDELKAIVHRWLPNVSIYDGLAASEGGPFAWAITSSTADLPSRFRAANGTRILDENDQDVPWDGEHVGVLAYGGKIPLGYYKDPEKTASTYRLIDGHRYVIPGDYVTVEPDGTLHIMGRRSGVINTGGEKVYPAEVEEALMAHDLVQDISVVGVPDEKWGEQVAAIMVLKPGTPDTAVADIIAWLKERLAGYKVPRRVVLTPEMTRTPTGKIEAAWAKKFVAEGAPAYGS